MLTETDFLTEQTIFCEGIKRIFLQVDTWILDSRGWKAILSSTLLKRGDFVTRWSKNTQYARTNWQVPSGNPQPRSFIFVNGWWDEEIGLSVNSAMRMKCKLFVTNCTETMAAKVFRGSCERPINWTGVSAAWHERVQRLSTMAAKSAQLAGEFFEKAKTNAGFCCLDQTGTEIIYWRSRLLISLKEFPQRLNRTRPISWFPQQTVHQCNQACTLASRGTFAGLEDTKLNEGLSLGRTVQGLWRPGWLISLRKALQRLNWTRIISSWQERSVNHGDHHWHSKLRIQLLWRCEH